MEEYNPWWSREQDPHIEAWESTHVKWVPEIIDRFKIDPQSINIVVGPRQVGKTTAIKLFIHRNLLPKFDRYSIFYYSCDEVVDYRELGEVLDTYQSFRREKGVRRSIIFLDEVGYVDEWWRAIKNRVDMGLFRGDTIYLTGSTGIEVLKGRERLPGRRGYGEDYIFHPIDFSEYVKNILGIDVSRRIPSDPPTLEEASMNKVFRRRLAESFNMYLETGGFPIPIKEYLSRGRVSTESIKPYLDWMRGDWVRYGRSERYMKEILSYILNARLTPISWNNIARNTSINSPNTVRTYLETLEDMMVAKILHYYRPGEGVDYRKNKKIHLLDPFLYRVLSRYTGVEVLTETLVESAVAMHLARRYDVYYYRGGEYEVDIVVRHGDLDVGYEVKWGVRRGRRSRLLSSYHLLDRESIPIFLASFIWD